MLGRGETLGVFQLESDGMKRVCVELQAVAARRHHRARRAVPAGPDGVDPAVHRHQARPHEADVPASQARSRFSRDTYGIALTKNRSCRSRATCAGFTMGQADELRKVMGRSRKTRSPSTARNSSPAAASNGIDAELAEQIFAFIEPFAGYGFNKAHAAAYGWIAYQTAYLKANYPLQYFAALMSSVRDKTDKLVEYIDEAKKMGIAVLPPDVNESLVDFAVVGEQIRFGLAAVKGVGEGAVRRSSRRATAAARSPICSIWRSASTSKLVEPQGLRGADQVRRARSRCPATARSCSTRSTRRSRSRRARRATARCGQASLFGAIEEPHRRSSRRCGRCRAPPDDGAARLGKRDARHLRLGSSARRRRRSARRAPARSPIHDLRDGRGRHAGARSPGWSPPCGAR